MCRVTCYVTCYVGTLQRIIFPSHALSRPDRRGARHARAEPVTRSWGLAEARRGRSRQWRITGEQDVRVADPEPELRAAGGGRTARRVWRPSRRRLHTDDAPPRGRACGARRRSPDPTAGARGVRGPSPRRISNKWYGINKWNQQVESTSGFNKWIPWRFTGFPSLIRCSHCLLSIVGTSGRDTFDQCMLNAVWSSCVLKRYLSVLQHHNHM